MTQVIESLPSKGEALSPEFKPMYHKKKSALKYWNVNFLCFWEV
jgi:hypothetical protein